MSIVHCTLHCTLFTVQCTLNTLLLPIFKGLCTMVKGDKPSSVASGPSKCCPSSQLVSAVQKSTRLSVHQLACPVPPVPLVFCPAAPPIHQHGCPSYPLARLSSSTKSSIKQPLLSTSTAVQPLLSTSSSVQQPPSSPQLTLQKVNGL